MSVKRKSGSPKKIGRNDFEINRIELNELNEWYLKTNRKPLLLRGARQVGKTSLVRMFSRIQKLDLIEVNLELHQGLKKSFLQMDPNLVLRDIELFFKKKVTSKTLLFIDEIQVVPEAIQGLRYFFEMRPNLPLIAAGSLLEFVLSEYQFSMPVGRIDIGYLGPLKFSDFVKAKKEEQLYKLLLNYVWGKEITSLEHENLLNLYLEFLLVGGMPEVVREYLKANDLKTARKIQKSILETYQADFAKYARRIPIERLERVFKFAGFNVGRKVKYSEINTEEQSKSLILAIDLLEKAGVINRIYHSAASGVPLSLGQNDKIFKFLFLDVGLVCGFLGVDHSEIKKIYFDPPSDLNLLHKGMITEQFVGQALMFQSLSEKGELFYWLREESTQKAEVDYIIEKGHTILPIEVKAGKTGSIKSLIQFAKEKKSKVAIKLGAQPLRERSVSMDTFVLEVLFLPIYLAEKIKSI